MNFGTKLRELRKARGMTLQEVASKAGIQPTHLSQIELGKLLPPKNDVLLRFKDALHLSEGDHFALFYIAGAERVSLADSDWGEETFKIIWLLGQALSVDPLGKGGLADTLKRFIRRHS